MAMSGSTPTLRCSCCGTRLWVKLHTSAELKPIRIAMPTVLGELRCGHITSVCFGMGWRELFSEMCPAIVPCATADEESGSSLKLGSCVDQPFMLLGTGKLVLEILSFKTNPCIKSSFQQK